MYVQTSGELLHTQEFGGDIEFDVFKQYMWKCIMFSCIVPHTYSSAFSSHTDTPTLTYSHIHAHIPPHLHTHTLGVSFEPTEVATEQTPLASDEVCVCGEG